MLHCNVLLPEILFNGREFEITERLIGDLILSLKEMASPDITASPIFAGTCLRGQMAHVGVLWSRGNEW